MLTAVKITPTAMDEACSGAVGEKRTGYRVTFTTHSVCLSMHILKLKIVTEIKI